MAQEKLFTAKQAALAVLRKVSELLAKSELVGLESLEKADPLNSIAGDRIKRGVGYKERGDKVSHKIAMEGAKESHKDRLEGIKNAPTPNLGKNESLEKSGKVMSDMSGGQKRGPQGYGKYQEQAQNQKGVHTPVSGVTDFPGGKGTSEAGSHAKDRYAGKPLPGLVEHSKKLHSEKLKEIRSMPSPNLGKAEGQNFKHADTHEGHDIHVGQHTDGKWAHQLFRHGHGHVHDSNSGPVFDSKDKAVEGAKVKIKANMKKHEIPPSKNECNEKVELKKAEPKGEIQPKEKEQAPPDGVRTQLNPEKNPDEQKEGNNELAGTTPTQVGQDGKNLPGYDEMKGHLKLAKFIGHMGAKRGMRKAQPKVG